MWQVVAAMVWRLQSGFDALLPIPPALDDETDTDRLRAGHYKVRSKAASAVCSVRASAACERRRAPTFPCRAAAHVEVGAQRMRACGGFV